MSHYPGVTVIPLDLSDDFVSDALRLAVADRVDALARLFTTLAVDLRGMTIIERDEWHRAFTRAAETHEQMTQVLAQAECFADQYPDEPGDDAAE